jgi:hypothetical protein
MITILNTSILTSFGEYNYTEINLSDAIGLIAGGYESAVGHKSTATVLTALLGVDVPENRVNYKQEIGSTALVFKLNGRPEEGKILTLEEIEAIGYSFGKLNRI